MSIACVQTGSTTRRVKVPPEACFDVYLTVNTVNIVARKLKKLRKLNLSAIQVLENFPRSADRALHWKGVLVLSNTRAVSECWAW